VRARYAHDTRILWKFDGQIRLSVTVGDLTALIHQLLNDSGSGDG
jgi:hypothetical protein